MLHIGNKFNVNANQLTLIGYLLSIEELNNNTNKENASSNNDNE
jgi:hypothetical protein